LPRGIKKRQTVIGSAGGATNLVHVKFQIPKWKRISPEKIGEETIKREKHSDFSMGFWCFEEMFTEQKCCICGGEGIGKVGRRIRKRPKIYKH